MDDLKEIRKKIFLTGYSASIAHLASAFSLVEILYTLYNKKILKYDSQNPNMLERDILILSKGHGSLALYTILCSVGFFDNKVLQSFSKPNSILGGEPTIPNIPGVEATTGSLGHGLSIGVGMALAKKMDNRNEKVYVIVGDGECEEGSTWEALMFAVKANLDNLIIIIDSNKIQKMDTISKVIGIDSWDKQMESFGCNIEKVDGHNIKEIEKALLSINKNNKPTVIIANTIKGKGASLMENDPRWHWRLPNKKELKTFMSELNISEEEIEDAKSIHPNTL